MGDIRVALFRKPHKYRAQKTVVDGELFDSKAEAQRWLELKLLELTGEISHLVRRRVFPFVINGKPVLIRSKGYPNGRAAKWTSDFYYIEQDGQPTAEDVKGMDLGDSKLRRALVEAIYGVRIKVTKASSIRTPRRRR